MRVGVIGDDFTGSSDIALMLAGASGEGLPTVQYVGVPTTRADEGVDAGVVSLKSRSTPPADAVARSLEALAWLEEQGAGPILFKICSTFDSTPEGNIGPVAEALARAIGTDRPVIVCPALPAAGRTVYRGHLFVDSMLLNESGLENHPLNPMTDANLVRWLGKQVAGEVGSVPWPIVARGVGAVRAALDAELQAGRQLVVCDALRDEDLRVLGQAMVAGGYDLAVCGSGLALGLPGLLRSRAGTTSWEPVAGPCVALSGSCSSATRAQLAAHEAADHPVRRIDVDRVLSGDEDVDALARWALQRSEALPVLATSDDPDAVARIQARHGRDASAAAVERLFGALARALVERGATRLVSAGGETSGAVVTALGATTLEIGPMIAPGVPAVAAELHGRRLGLVLKSGNFGQEDFFARAARILGG